MDEMNLVSESSYFSCALYRRQAMIKETEGNLKQISDKEIRLVVPPTSSFAGCPARFNYLLELLNDFGRNAIP